jgi:hypothetical protein
MRTPTPTLIDAVIEKVLAEGAQRQLRPLPPSLYDGLHVRRNDLWLPGPMSACLFRLLVFLLVGSLSNSVGIKRQWAVRVPGGERLKNPLPDMGADCDAADSIQAYRGSGSVKLMTTCGPSSIVLPFRMPS